MLDYDKFYDDYCVADCTEKAKLLEQLKVVLFFGYDDVTAIVAVKLASLGIFRKHSQLSLKSSAKAASCGTYLTSN